MLLRILAVTGACIMALVAITAYSPLPDDMEDRSRAMFFLGVFKLLLVTPFHISEWLGYGSFLDNLESIQKLQVTDRSVPPPSAAKGVLEVTRDTIADLPVNVYRPKDMAEGELLPALVYIHGGGWVFVTADMADTIAHLLANCTRQILIAIDYPHAPGHPFPTAVQASLAVTKHVLSKGKAMGIDVNRVGIVGDANGGNMAAAIALHLTKEKNSGLPPLKYQALLWPPMQAMNLQLPSYVEVGEIIQHPPAHTMAGFWAAYLGLDPTKLDEYATLMLKNGHVSKEFSSKYSKYVDTKNLPEKYRKPRPEIMGREVNPGPEVKTDDKLFQQIKDKLVNPLMSPLMAPDLHGVPPAFVLVSEYEIVRDDGLLYAHRLREAGVRTEVSIGRGFHLDINPILPPPFHSKTGEKSFKAVCSFMRKNA